MFQNEQYKNLNIKKIYMRRINLWSINCAYLTLCIISNHYRQQGECKDAHED